MNTEFTEAEYEKIKNLFSAKRHELQYMVYDSVFNVKQEQQYRAELYDFTVLEEKMMALLQREMNK